MKHHKFIYDKTFVRNFDEMYKSIDDPHGQKVSSENLSHDIYLFILEKIIKNQKENNWYDFGCGLGYFTERIGNLFSNFSLTGIDISETSIKKVQNKKCNYLSGNILDDIFLKALKKVNVVSLFETLYYFETKEINKVVRNIDRILKDRGYLVITYHIPKKMNYGKYVSNLKDLKGIFKDYTAIYESDFKDSYSKIYSDEYFGRHLFIVFQKR